MPGAPLAYRLAVNDFDERTVVVTGGTGFLGTAVVEHLVGRGARVVVPAARPEEVDRFALREHPQVTLRPGVDLTDEDAVQGVFQGIDDLWASIHLAGGFAMGPIGETTLETWQGMMDTNATTCFLCCREAVGRIRARAAAGGDEASTGGRIVNVAAKPVLVPGGKLSAYAASKAAVVSLTQTLSEELADESIWVNAILPSTLDTPVNRSAMPSADHDAWPDLGDVAETIGFLASPANKTTRGALVPVYGRS